MTAAASSLPALFPDIAGLPPLALAGLSLDARTVSPGGAFVALRGGTRHGLDFLSQALARGATAVLWDPAEAPATLPAFGAAASIEVPALRARLGAVADRFHGAPSARLAIAGVTGTNGKTTCAWLIASALGRLGGTAGYGGTLGFGIPPAVAGGTHTTPDVLTAHRQLAELAAAGATHVALEVSSHALDQGRIDGVRLRIAAFTNLSRDHLDYHGTMERYAAAKARLFAQPGVEHAVINTDDATGRGFAAALPGSIVLTAVGRNAARIPAGARHVIARGVHSGAAGLELELDTWCGPALLASRLVGDFNVDNLLVVLGVLLAFGQPLSAVVAALQTVTAPPGRMETVGTAGGPLAIVDYAHTPDALEKALTAARGHCRGRLTVVFGCGGDRDAGKRPLMGAIAERLADVVILTDDNPRGEPAAAILAAVRGGMRAPQRAQVVHDRRAALELAWRGVADGDVVLVAGKGHEDHQETAGARCHFSDREELERLAGAPS